MCLPHLAPREVLLGEYNTTSLLIFSLNYHDQLKLLKHRPTLSHIVILSLLRTVTFLNKSAMVWIGWGDLYDGETSDQLHGTGESHEYILLKLNNIESFEGRLFLISLLEMFCEGIPAMGPLVVSMPRTKYSSFGNADETACSQLVGGQSEEEMMMGWQMAGRLSKKVGWPVFVSSSLVGSLMNNSDGSGDMGDLHGSIMGGNMVALQAASHAEKEVARIIMERKAASS